MITTQSKSKLSWAEMLMVVMVLGIVASFAFPRLNTMQANSAQVKQRSLEMIKTSYAIAISDLMTFPTSQEFAEYVDADNVQISRSGGGIEFDFDARRMRVITYTDSACSVPTSASNQPILCVGEVTEAPVKG